MTWWEYVETHARGDLQKVIASKSGVDQSTVSRWRRGGAVDPTNVVTFARAYGQPVLEALVVAGFLTPKEANERPSAPASLDKLSDSDLLAEVRARMKEGRNGRQPAAQKIADPGDGWPRAAREGDVPKEDD